jgi:hypothetical protein
MMNNTSAVIELPPIDHERDIRPVAVVVPDYNGDPIVHVFVTGERIARMEPQDDWRYEFTLCTTSAERQAYEGLAYRLGELSEDADQHLAAVWGLPYESLVFDEVTSNIDGHLMVAWLGTVAQAVYDLDPEYLPKPTGW